MTQLIIVSLAAFWLTHVHVWLIRKYNIQLRVKEWGYCYHCISFWYALLLVAYFQFFPTNFIPVIILSACAGALLLQEVYVRWSSNVS